MTVDPSLVAEADQHIAATNQFLNTLIQKWRQLGHDDAVTVCRLSVFLHDQITAPYGLSDALAVAVRQLAAHKGEQP